MILVIIACYMMIVLNLINLINPMKIFRITGMLPQRNIQNLARVIAKKIVCVLGSYLIPAGSAGMLHCPHLSRWFQRNLVVHLYSSDVGETLSSSKGPPNK